MKPRIRRPLQLTPLVAALAVAAAPAAAGPIDTRLEGLPPGLLVTVGAALAVCTGNGVTTRGLASQVLAEQTFVNWEVVTLPFGGTTVVQRTRTAYVGQLNVPSQVSSSGCSFGNQMTLTATLLGESGGQLRARESGVLASGAVTSMTRLHATLEAKTSSLTSLVAVGGFNQAVVPTAIDRGQTQRWTTSHHDGMGVTSVVEPTLDFMVPSNIPFPGSTMSRARISIATDGKVCVRAGTSNVCRTRAQGGTVVNGGVEVDVADTEHSTAGGLATTRWRFRLDTSFPAGTVTARVGADDLDTIDYLVDGVATPLNLLPWKTFSLPILVN